MCLLEASHTWEGQVNTPQFLSSILTFLQKRGGALVVVVVLPGWAGWCFVMGTQGFWPHTPQLFSCGSARPGEWLAAKVPLCGGRRSWQSPGCLIPSPSLFHQCSNRTPPMVESTSAETYANKRWHLAYLGPTCACNKTHIYNKAHIHCMWFRSVTHSSKEVCLGTSRRAED